jgi:hypothetical protein
MWEAALVAAHHLVAKVDKTIRTKELDLAERRFRGNTSARPRSSKSACGRRRRSSRRRSPITSPRDEGEDAGRIDDGDGLGIGSTARREHQAGGPRDGALRSAASSRSQRREPGEDLVGSGLPGGVPLEVCRDGVDERLFRPEAGRAQYVRPERRRCRRARSRRGARAVRRARSECPRGRGSRSSRLLPDHGRPPAWSRRRRQG